MAPWNTTAVFAGTIINASSNKWSGRYQPAFESQVAPVTIELVSPGHYFIDFGKDAFGYLNVHMNGSFSGQTLTVRMGERAIGSSVNTTPGDHSLQTSKRASSKWRPDVRDSSIQHHGGDRPRVVWRSDAVSLVWNYSTALPR